MRAYKSPAHNASVHRKDDGEFGLFRIGDKGKLPVATAALRPGELVYYFVMGLHTVGPGCMIELHPRAYRSPGSPPAHVP